MMETDSRVSTGLYPRLLGDSWNNLDVTVRHLHVQGRPVRATGSFRIRHGTGRLARGLLRLCGMPSAGAGVPTQLVVTPHGHREQWVRTFGDQPLATTQCGRGRDVLVERLGILEFRFRLEVTDGELIYRQTGMALCLGPLSVLLPRWIAPEVVAREGPAGMPNRTQVSVQVLMPWVGLLIAYEGAVTSEEAPG